MKRVHVFFSLALCLMPVLPLFSQAPGLYGGPLGVERVALKSNYSMYQSSKKENPNDTCWIQVDLGKSYSIDQVKMFPIIDENWVVSWRRQFPVRYYIEASDAPDFKNATLISDQTREDNKNPIADMVESYKPAKSVTGRYVRLTVTKLPSYRERYCFDLWRFEVISNGRNVAESRTLFDSDKGYLGKHPLLRPARPMGEYAIIDCPENVTSPDIWKPVIPDLSVPRTGVKVSGLFEQVLDRNAHYLLRSFTANDMLRDFKERAGHEPGPKDRPLSIEWVNFLPGSNAGRFMMGAGNQLRWKENSELRKRMNEIVDGIDTYREPNGYLLGYPEKDITKFENGAYCRSWVTQGLIEAGIAGNEKAFPMLRKFYDWFDTCPYLPELSRRGGQGRQGVIANTRMYFTPVGKPLDLHVVQRYYQENFWMDQLIDRDVDAIWQYPYDRPHCYLLVSMEAFSDMYMATGDKKYLEAAKGGWDLYHDYYQHVGGSISVCEHADFPPKSQLLWNSTGELCGNSFWAFFNQRLHLLEPEAEKYVTEIEKSIYNVGIANQTENGGIMYHANIIRHKEEGTDFNTCCEGQGTRLYGALPEFIYTLSKDGIYVDLFNPSSVTWEQNGTTFAMEMKTKFPQSSDVKLQLTLSKKAQSKIRVRIPSWCTKEVDIAVNGSKAASGKPGSYVTLDRTWEHRDEISFNLPMGFRMKKYDGQAQDFAGKEAYALEYGPFLMSVTGKSMKNGYIDLPLRADELIAKLRPVSGKPLTFRVDGTDSSVLYRPYYQIGE